MNTHITVTYKRSPGYPCDNYTHVAITMVSKIRSSLSSDEVSSPFGSISDVPQPMLQNVPLGTITYWTSSCIYFTRITTLFLFDVRVFNFQYQSKFKNSREQKNTQNNNRFYILLTRWNSFLPNAFKNFQNAEKSIPLSI